MTLKVTQGHRSCHNSIYHFLLVVCSNNVSTLIVFEITTLTLYVIDCDLEMSFSFDMTVDITGHTCAVVQV